MINYDSYSTKSYRVVETTLEEIESAIESLTGQALSPAESGSRGWLVYPGNPIGHHAILLKPSGKGAEKWLVPADLQIAQAAVELADVFCLEVMGIPPSTFDKKCASYNTYLRIIGRKVR